MNHLQDIRQRTITQIQSWLADRLSAPDSQQASRLVDCYFQHAQRKELTSLSLDNGCDAMLCLWLFIQQRTAGTIKARAYNPESAEQAWHSTHSIIEILVADRPFLVASVLMELDRQDVRVHSLNHPIIHTQRDTTGQLIALAPITAKAPTGKNSKPLKTTANKAAAFKPEALIRIEIDRQPDHRELERLATGIEKTINDVRCVVDDWSAMQAQLDEAIAWCQTQSLPIANDNLKEALAFLQWLKDDHFLFVGFRYYHLTPSNQGTCQQLRPGSGLGMFRDVSRANPAEPTLSPYLTARLQAPELLVITKATSRSFIQRPAHLDYLGIKQFNDQGMVIGEWRFFGLFASKAYTTPLAQVPVLRQKVANLLNRADMPASSHRGKALRHIVNNYPRDEILQATPEQLYDTIMGILDCQTRRQLRAFLRPDSYGRFITAMVYVPRDHFNTALRGRLQHILLAELGGHSVDFNVHLSENPFVQLQLTVHCRNAHELTLDVDALEATMAEAMLGWQDHLRQALLDQHGEAQGSRLYQRYSQAFPAAYQEDVQPRQAVTDMAQLQALATTDAISTLLYRPADDSDRWHFRVLGKGQPLALSDVLPILEKMGVRVFSARPYSIHPRGSDQAWVLDFSITLGSSAKLEDRRLRQQFQQVFVRTWRGELENDGFNALVIHVGLAWQQVVLFRALAKYLLQLQVPFSQVYMEQVLNRHAVIAQALVDLFTARFEPDSTKHAKKDTDHLADTLNTLLDDVAHLDEDRILRHFLSVIQAMQRTNAFQKDAHGHSKPYLSFKVRPDQIPAARLPRPLFEIFVYAPHVEGIHMRSGKIARGGLRWSDRQADFRTEILGLLKAQMIKNAIIVPHGAKGGFVPKQLPSNGDRDQWLAAGMSSYQTFIAGLLDITDNLRQGTVIPPTQVVRYDDDDPYLVVAADKGTTAFSDMANEIASDYGFWLGDAFASGGSQGYDHKKMGITARGAWESVKRLFTEKGIDTQQQDFTVIAIGDMSGDVFGNGMLLSPHIRLIAAFNHRHIFIDPTPDTQYSYAERQRLFNLPRSSWNDYDRSLLSKGGGIYSRQAKKIKLSPEARQLLASQKTVLTPNELIQTMLAAPADLLWNGGIGTYVKASTEDHAAVGDRANDAVRIDATALQVQVIGEGGNLGLTQQARIEYARRGGLITIDAIDNAGGVDSSDHEVNIKILLDQIVAAGAITLKQRNRLLADMTDEVAALVLHHNRLQSQRLSLSVHQSSTLFSDHRDFIRQLEQEGRLNRQLECLPDDATLEVRNKAGEGLCRPEIAVLLSHAKLKYSEALVTAKVDADPYLAQWLYHYFPTPLRERFPEQIHQHPLKTEILATHLTNQVVNRMGATFIEYIQQEVRCSTLDVVRAFIAVIEIQAIQPIWDQFEALGFRAEDTRQRDELVRVQRQIEKACIWLLRTHGNNLNTEALIATYQPGYHIMAARLPNYLGDRDRQWLQNLTDQLISAGFTTELADACASLRYRYHLLNVVAIAQSTQQPVDDTATIYFALEECLTLPWLRSQVRRLPMTDRWRRKARSSLRDQLDRSLRDNCVRALLSSGQTVAERLADWTTKNNRQLARWQTRVTEIQSCKDHNLAMLSVAIRDLSAME